MKNLLYTILICVCIGYFIGVINPSYILSRMKGFDIRKRGSGNAGASNAMIVLGKTVGVFCALFDIFKAYIAVRISQRLFPLFKVAGIITGSACILGHIFPVTMKFKGGKGLACLAGVAISYDAKLFLILLAFEAVLAYVTNYICTVATSGSAILGTVMYLRNGIVYLCIFLPVIVVIWTKHIINIRRIRYGVEARFSYLWNKKEEQERIRNNWNKLSEEEKLYVKLPELV